MKGLGRYIEVGGNAEIILTRGPARAKTAQPGVHLMFLTVSEGRAEMGG